MAHTQRLGVAWKNNDIEAVMIVKEGVVNFPGRWTETNHPMQTGMVA